MAQGVRIARDKPADLVANPLRRGRVLDYLELFLDAGLGSSPPDAPMK